ncbi:MAG: hypothetical protein KGV44_14650 [Flavobacteriaceae bacterium]|nr:hypothetical protein [Flavobacteriaceae bacterium]
MAFSGIFMACSDDDKIDPCVEIIAKSTEKVTKIAEKYAKEQTAENCKAYKKAIEEYLVATKECPDATPEKYKEVLKTLNCEELEMKENIVGKWVFEKIIENGVEQKDDDDACPAKKGYLEFLVNNIFKSVDYNQDCKEDIDESIWEINDKLLIFEDKGSNEKDIFIIKTLTTEELIMQFKELYKDGKKEPMDENEDGKPDEVIYYFKRMK